MADITTQFEQDIQFMLSKKIQQYKICLMFVVMKGVFKPTVHLL